MIYFCVMASGRLSNGIRRVAVMLRVEGGYVRPILRGVLRYAGEASNWRVQGAEIPGVVDGPFDEDCDGGIIQGGQFDLVKRLKTRGVPLVTVSENVQDPGIPLVAPDNEAVGAMAADHLNDRGFQRFVGVGSGVRVGSRRRLKGFYDRVAAVGGRLLEQSPTRETSGGRTPAPPLDWLRGLPTPCGVFCSNDDTAYRFIRAAHEAGLAVPEDLAVVGVHNHDLVCEMVQPGISSVLLQSERQGYEAAALLDRMMDGERPPAQAIRFPPVRVVERDSTRTIAVADPVVAEALAVIRRGAIEGMNVDELCERMTVTTSRRTLERRFKEAVGRSPNAEIRRLRCQRAAELLLSTNESLDQVGRRCGFNSLPFFSNTFAKVMGARPGAFREQHRQR